MPTLLDILVKEHLAPPMANAGYRKRRHTWNNGGDGIVRVVQVDSSRFNTLPRQSFGLVLGVASSRVLRIVWAEDLPRFVGFAKCAYRTATGFLPGQAPGPRGRPVSDSWTVEHPRDVDVVGPQCAEVLTRFVLPFLSRVTTELGLYKLLAEPRPYEDPERAIYRLVAECFFANRSNAISELQAMRGQHDNWRPRIDSVLSNLQVATVGEKS